jgi:hypothetical protein
MLGIENVTELLLNTEMMKYFNSIKRSTYLFLRTCFVNCFAAVQVLIKKVNAEK